MTVIKPPSPPQVSSTRPTQETSKPSLAPQSPEPPTPSPGVSDGFDASSVPGQSTAESQQPAQPLVKPSSSVGATQPPTITVTAPPVPPAIDAVLLNALPEQDPSRLQVPVDQRIDEAKANLAEILDALGAHPELTETHERLESAIKELTTKHALHEHQLALHETPSTGPGSELRLESSRIQSEASEIESEITELKEQLELLQDPVKHERLSSKSKALLAKLNDFPSINTDFQQAYSAFVKDYGDEVANSHNLSQNVGVMRQNVDVLKKNGENLDSQRDHMRKLLDRPMSSREFKRLESHINKLVSHFERHTKDVEKFNESAKGLVGFMDSLRDNKEAAQAERRYVTETKAKLIAALDVAIDSEFDGSKLQTAFAKARDTVGEGILDERGFTRNLEVLQHNLSNVEDSLHNVRSYAQMLKADVEKADHKGWVDARKENIQEVQSQLKQFNELKANYELDLSGFLKDLSTLEKSVSNAPVSETKKNLHERLQSLPLLLDVNNPLADQDLASLSTDLKEESSQIKNEFNQLSRSIRIIQKKVGALEKEISGVTSQRDIEAVREKLGTLSSLIKRHNSDVRTQLRLADRVLDKLTGPTESRDTTFVVPKLSKNGKTLLDHISRGKDPFFGTMNISRLSYSSGRKITFTTDDRIAVWDSLLKKDASIDINKPNRSGNTMIHQIIMSGGMDESDKVRMVEYLGSKGADLNIKSRDGLQPVELALRLSVKQPELVDTLRDLGAQVSLKEQIPIFAHLIGAGGEVSLKKGGKVQRVALEGLSPNFAAFGLDPAFVESLDELQSRTDGPINSIYQRMERGWVNTMSYEKFIGRVRDAKIGIDTKGGVPEVLSTGWDHPSGHAISFVFNHEPDGYYFYACNTGDAKDPDRSIVKYKVSDFDNFLSFLKTSSRNADHTRSLYVGQPERLGLDRVPEKDQLPASIDKSSQKIGNCTVASRKAALLAMMWSEGRDFSIPPQELKSAYKEVTTELRERGIRGAISSGHMDLMGKSLVKMLTKFDRPACQDYAFELASAMVRKSTGQKAAPSGGKPESAPPADSSEYLNTLGRAVQIGELNLQQRSSNGQTLAEYARSEGNLKAANILEQLAIAA